MRSLPAQPSRTNSCEVSSSGARLNRNTRGVASGPAMPATLTRVTPWLAARIESRSWSRPGIAASVLRARAACSSRNASSAGPPFSIQR
jgi:hypothetical protein